MIAGGEDMELRLVGYVAHVSHGFALPLFGQHDRANTLYVADCWPSGDHGGTISRFDVHEPASNSWLPADQSIVARVGEPWLDVFVWNDMVFVGSAQSVWDQLAPIKAELEQFAPLSLLDAAMNADLPERETLAPVAMSYVADRFTAERAMRWREGILRRHLVKLVRRTAPQFQENPAAAKQLVSADGTTAYLNLPRSLSDQLSKGAALEPLIEDALRFATSLGLRLDLQRDTSSNPPKESRLQKHNPVESNSRPGSGAVLVLLIGRRAREIARHIDEPGWFPADVMRDGGSKDIRVTPKVIHVVNGDDPRAAEKLAPSYEVVLVLIDDINLDDQLKSRTRTLLDLAKQLGRVRILVPALPEDCPAKFFDDEAASPFLSEWQFHAVLDTAQARSPFWWGNPKRSLDRRIADVISSAACLNLSARIIDGVARSARSNGPALMILAMDLERGRGPHNDPEWSLSSESTWFEPGPPTVRGRVHLKETVEVRTGDGRGVKRASLECRSIGQYFDSFAIAVMNDLFDDERVRVTHGPEVAEPPQVLMQTLRFPRQTFAFQFHPAAEPQKLLLAAETPTVEALLAADRSGWQVVRYTDRDTLRRLALAEAPIGRRNVPSEVALGSITASDINRRLAVRGVDTRDVIRMTPDQLHEWLDGVSPDDRRQLRAEIRPLRVTGDPSAAGGPPGFAARRKQLLEGRLEDDPALRALIDILKVDSDEIMERRPYKRAADLDACWTAPADGFMRFALADGEIPPLIAPLGPEEIVLQTSFILDGDWSVPALFRSQVFAIWAAATLSRSSSWMSRFSVGATFAGFPVTPRFSIVGTNGTGCALQSDDNDLLELASEVEAHIERMANAGRGTNWKSAQRSELLRELPAAKRLEAMILSAYDLPADADDLSILERLVVMNGMLQRS
ncbi:hypothetical protein [Mesorhizobium sp. M0146]|uniref:hypothetical protein n=1 Tax=unclassified Mesorhizobium TaxID=325217 RepID=UPI00333DEACE